MYIRLFLRIYGSVLHTCTATYIQDVPKVGIQFIVNYCIHTVYIFLAHPVFIVIYLIHL